MSEQNQNSVIGIIEKTMPLETSKPDAEKQWAKMTFVIKTPDQYNNVYPIEIFGQDKIDNFFKYNNVGDEVEVLYNVNAREWNGKFFTTLSSWRVNSITKGSAPATADAQAPEEEEGDLPF